MNLYIKARRHIDVNRVKKLHEKKVAKQIALQEQQYLLYFTENTIPKYYNWETGQFNVNPLAEVKSAVFKRLEEIDDALLEGMTMKDFKYLYGGEIGSQILSISPTLVSSTFAQNLISASGEVTSHMFGPEFPGSHINSIGDFDKPQSLSKADINAMAVPTPAGDAISWNPFDQTLPTNFQLGHSTPTPSHIEGGWGQNDSDPGDVNWLDYTAELMVSRGETTDTHTDIYYTPNISQTDATITITRQSRTGSYIDYTAMNSDDLMQLTGLWSVSGAQKPMDSFDTLDQVDDTDLRPMPYGYDSEGPDPEYPDENADLGEPIDLMPMLRTYNNKSAGDVVSFEWEFNAGNDYTNNSSNSEYGGDADDSAWVYINGSNTWYRLANVYDHSNHRIGDDAFYNDDDPSGDSRQEDNAGRKNIRPEFRSGGSGKLTGTFSYTVQSGDIDSNGNLKVWIVNNQMSLFNKAVQLKISNFTGTTSAAGKRKQAAGQLGKTTDAYDLGYPVRSMLELRKLLTGYKNRTKIKKKKYTSRYGNNYYSDFGDDKVDNETEGEKDWNNWKEKIKARDNAKKLTPTQQKQIQKQVRKAISDNPEIANAIEKLGSQGKTYFDYITDNLPDVIDNNYLGDKYVNSIFKDASVDSKGNISVGDNIVGTGGKATYDPKTGKVTIPFNYDFDTNAQEIEKNPERLQNKTGFKKVIIDITKAVGGEYGLDSLPVAPAGRVTAAAKSMGGAKGKPGKVTMSADQVNKINPSLYMQVTGNTGLRKEELYLGQPSPNGFPDTPPPKMINGYHPEYGKRSDRYRTLDPISAKTMNKVGTDDPKTNKQVADAAKKPKVNESTWDKLKRHRPRG